MGHRAGCTPVFAVITRGVRLLLPAVTEHIEGHLINITHYRPCKHTTTRYRMSSEVLHRGPVYYLWQCLNNRSHIMHNIKP